MGGNIYFNGDGIMWIETFDGKFVNTNYLVSVEIELVGDGSDKCFVKAVVVNRGIEALFVGYGSECVEYVGKLYQILDVKQVEL